jgi:hypothetical protein
MRRHLARHVHAARLAFPHGAQRLPRAHVGDVHVRRGELRERDIPLDHQRFGGARDAAQAEKRRPVAFVRNAISLQRWILAVVDDRRLQHPGVFERASHQQRRGHWPSVVRERHTAGRALLAELRKLLAARAE